MTRIGEFLRQIHHRSLWQALAVYIGACFAALEAIDLLIERVGLPNLFFPVALVLLVIGLPVILLTAFVQSAPDGRDEPSSPSEGRTAGETEDGALGEGPHSDLGRLLTWRNAIGGGVVAFALWGIVAAGWLLLAGRPGGVAEVAADAPTRLAPTSVAVLYFEDFSENQDLGYLADGFTEALIHELAQVGGLRVISRNGVKPYRDPEIAIDSVARALNVGSIVEGSIERVGDALRLTVQLIDGADGSHLFSGRVERSGDNLLKLREDVVLEATWLLRQRLGAELVLRERRAGTSSDRAWELVQRAEEFEKDAKELWSAGDRAASTGLLLRADSLLATAEELDPDWPEPVILRGSVARTIASQRADEYGEYDSTTAKVALSHVDRAVERWPDHPDALGLRGNLRARLWEQSRDSAAAKTLRSAAERDLRRAVELDPKLATAWADLSRLERKTGRFAAAKLAAEKAYRADAYLADAAYVLFNLCHISIELKEFEEAARWCDEGETRFPERGFFIEPQLLLLASAIGPPPDADRAWDLYERMMATYPPQRREGLRPVYLMYLAAVLARAGQEDSARSIIDGARRRDSSDDLTIEYYEANARLRLGEPEKALDLLATYVQGNPGQKEYLARDWWWEELHDNPRFRGLIGLPE